MLSGLQQAGERNFSPHIHRTWGPPFSTSLYCLKGSRDNSLVDLRGDDGEHLVGLQGQPAHGEDHHDEHEHLHRLLLVAQDAVVAPLVLLARHAVPPEVLEAGQGKKDGESWLGEEQYIELFLFLVKTEDRQYNFRTLIN